MSEVITRQYIKHVIMLFNSCLVSHCMEITIYVVNNYVKSFPIMHSVTLNNLCALDTYYACFQNLCVHACRKIPRRGVPRPKCYACMLSHFSCVHATVIVLTDAGKLPSFSIIPICTPLKKIGDCISSYPSFIVSLN